MIWAMWTLYGLSGIEYSAETAWLYQELPSPHGITSSLLECSTGYVNCLLSALTHRTLLSSLVVSRPIDCWVNVVSSVILSRSTYVYICCTLHIFLIARNPVLIFLLQCLLFVSTTLSCTPHQSYNLSVTILLDYQPFHCCLSAICQI